MAHTRLYHHVVFATARRHPWLAKPIREQVYRYMSGISNNLRSPLIIAGGIEDHVHLLSDLHPTIAPANYARDIKANASRFIHETFKDLGAFGWQASYSAFSVSPSIVPRVRRYIENQEQHHRKVPFLDELRWLYEAHGLPFDLARWNGTEPGPDA